MPLSTLFATQLRNYRPPDPTPAPILAGGYSDYHYLFATLHRLGKLFPSSRGLRRLPRSQKVAKGVLDGTQLWVCETYIALRTVHRIQTILEYRTTSGKAFSPCAFLTSSGAPKLTHVMPKHGYQFHVSQLPSSGSPWRHRRKTDYWLKLQRFRYLRSPGAAISAGVRPARLVIVCTPRYISLRTRKHPLSAFYGPAICFPLVGSFGPALRGL
ncbi:hypothetical protein B0H34DRAFT_711974 [Crassisporium funariophilum]|nr:hypothetical protein B0H34DRAFT_711974 [Crassisporium funariophilum]